jgi:hypothetical protein
MSISTPPVQKKRGLGCLGCGCVALVLLVILFLALVGGIGYFGYAKTLSFTSTTPAAIPTFNDSDDLFQSARQKVADFDHDVKNHQAATIQLSADEINSLIDHNPDVAKNNLHAFVTLMNNEGRVQASLPTDALSYGMIKGRYFNLDTSFGVDFDSLTKSVNLIPRTLQFGDKALIGSGSNNEASTRSFAPVFNQSFNNAIRKNPDGAALLDQAKSIEIKDGQLVIETQ